MCVVVGVFCLEGSEREKEEVEHLKCLRCYETLNPKKRRGVSLSLSLSLSLSRWKTIYVCAKLRRHSLTYARFLYTHSFLRYHRAIDDDDDVLRRLL